MHISEYNLDLNRIAERMIELRFITNPALADKAEAEITEAIEEVARRTNKDAGAIMLACIIYSHRKLVG
jgi:hypothetical protein